MHRFYVPDFPASGDVQLPEDEALHLARVLRLSPGDTVVVFDGRGREALARVESVASRCVSVAVIEPRASAAEPSVHVTLAQALLKSDKMDRVIRDAVMLGAAAIQPFVSRRTDIPTAAIESGVRQKRWDRTVISSVKQSGRAVVPPVLHTVAFEELLARAGGARRLMFVEPVTGGSVAVSDLAALGLQRPAAAVVMIGPEGGWAPEELVRASESGVTLVTLGRQVLRADAAGLVALSVLRYIWQDL